MRATFTRLSGKAKSMGCDVDDMDVHMYKLLKEIAVHEVACADLW